MVQSMSVLLTYCLNGATSTHRVVLDAGHRGFVSVYTGMSLTPHVHVRLCQDRVRWFPWLPTLARPVTITMVI